jgi:hypothetical protein
MSRHRPAWWLAAVVLAFGAGTPALARGPGDVDASVTVAKRQGQSGEVIRVTAFVAANSEAVMVDGKGEVRVGGKWRRLYPKGTPLAINPLGGAALKLRPTPPVAKRIAAALNEGRRPRARFTVVLSDAAGSVERPRYRVRLTR